MDRRLIGSSEGELSGRSKRQRVEGHASGSGSNLEHLRRMHRFPMESRLAPFRPQELHEVHSSQQAEASSLFAYFGFDIEFGSLEFRDQQTVPPDQIRVTSSQSLAEIQQPFAAHHPAEASTSQQADVRRQDPIEQRQGIAAQRHEVYDQADPSDHLRPKDQVEQGQGTLPRQSEVPHQAGQTDMIGPMKQIEDAPLTWKRRREMLERLIQSYQPPEQGQAILSQRPEAHNQAGQIDIVELIKHIENLTELTWKQRREFLEAWIRFSQPPEQGQAILPQRHEGQDQAGPSHHGDTQRESTTKQERTWTMQQLHQLVDEIVQIKDFDHKTFQHSLSEESKAIFEQLNEYQRSLHDQEWDDIRTKFQDHKVSIKDKRYKYLRTKTENSRNLQKQREIRANIKAQLQGFKSRHERYYKKPRPDDAPEPS